MMEANSRFFLMIIIIVIVAAAFFTPFFASWTLSFIVNSREYNTTTGCKFGYTRVLDNCTNGNITERMLPCLNYKSAEALIVECTMRYSVFIVLFAAPVIALGYAVRRAIRHNRSN